MNDRTTDKVTTIANPLTHVCTEG